MSAVVHRLLHNKFLLTYIQSVTIIVSQMFRDFEYSVSYYLDRSDFEASIHGGEAG